MASTKKPKPVKQPKNLNGWIDDVDGGVVYGRLFLNKKEYEFSLPILSVMECQRVELEPRRYVSFVNGHMLIKKSIWTTHEIEQAVKQARKWAKLFKQPVKKPDDGFGDYGVKINGSQVISRTGSR